MERAVPAFSERQGDGATALLMPPEPTNEAFGAPQGQERRSSFLHDAKNPPENPALSEPEPEPEEEEEEDTFYTTDGLVTMSREVKGPPGMEGTDFFSSLSGQEPGVALEAHDVADEPHPALSGAVGHRTELGPPSQDPLEFHHQSLFGTDSLRPVPVPGAASWPGSAPPEERSTLGRLSGTKDSEETPFATDPPPVPTLQLDHQHLESDLRGGTAAPDAPVGAGAGVSEKYLPTQPKQLEGLTKEHLEKTRRTIQRLDWITKPTRSPSPHHKDTAKATDVAATAAPFRGAAARQVPAAFRKTPNPSTLGKTKPSESSSHRKGLVVDSDLAEWAMPKPNLQLTVGKQSWTVNAEDSVERVPALEPALEPAPCSSYEVEMRPYLCGVLVEEQPKEDLGNDDDPSVFTCIECSIYFKKKEHLMDHMSQHNRGPGSDRAGDAAPGQCRFCCNECGWAFGDPTSLEQHKRLHQESREKIIEEIQKLNEFPDEGRDARLQCPKCVFGTNSSKIFVQHAKMHVKERKDQGAKATTSLFGSTGGGETHDGTYKTFKPNEPLVPPAPHGGAKTLSACVLCGFPAPNENILKEHMRYAHSHLAWEAQVYEDDANQPGTSRDSFGRFADADYFGKAERLFPHHHSPAHYDPHLGFTLAQPRLNQSDGATKRDYQASGYHARKAAAPSAAPPPHRTLGLASAKAYSQLALQQLRRKTAAQHLEGDGDALQSHPAALEELRHRWALANDAGAEDISVGTDLGWGEGRATRPVPIPQAALDLKRTFRDTLRATDAAVASEEQQHQLRMMVPLVLLEEMNLHPKATKRPRAKTFKRKTLMVPPRDFVMEEPLPLDVLLLDTPLEGPLELEELLDSDSNMLKNEERKCPYCPDRFHNGIGLANHVRGHLNRVGVSYNVRHFISAEEVKAIEQKFSFQKKKKKVANFDPSTFSLMRCEFCGAGFDTRAGLSSHARAHLRDFGITNWELTISPINILKELLANSSEHPALAAALGAEPASPGRDRDALGFVPRKGVGAGVSECGVARAPLSPFAPAWGEEPLQPYRDVLAPEDEDLVAMEVASPPPIPKKSPLEPPPPPRIGTKLSPEPPGNKPEPQDSKAQGLTTCEVCGACFETRKGLSSHARSHLRQLGVAESESSGAPIDLLYELVRHKGKTDGPSLPTPLAKKSASPKEAAPRPALLALAKAAAPPEGAVNKAIKSPPGFAKALSQPGSPVLKKVPPALSASPKGAGEEKGSKLALSPLPGSPQAQWAPEEDGPLNLTSGSEPSRDIRCEFCGEFFENRKGLSSHARSHLRQMGVTEWYVNGSPIDTLREILKRRRAAGNAAGNNNAKSLLGALGALEPRAPVPTPTELHIPNLGKKVPSPASSPPPPTARKMFPGLSPPPSLQKKLKQDQLRVEIKRELMAGGIHAEPRPSDRAWSPREEMAPLNLSSRADLSRDIRCEFCGEFFENRKGLSSHARSHLRQMGVTEWSVNGSPIDTLREILRKKSKPCLIKKEPLPSGLDPAPPKTPGEDGMDHKAPVSASVPPVPAGKVLAGLTLAPLGGRPGKAGAALALAPLGAKGGAGGAFLAPKRPLAEDRLGPHGDAKHKAFGGAEMTFKAKALHEKGSSEACCELCGLYFENRKALASHARAHLRQFGVTEWCVNGSPIETLREWIRHRPHKAGAYRSYIQGGRPFSKKFRNSPHSREHSRAPLALQAGAVAFLGKGIPAELPRGAGDAGKGPDGAERPLLAPLALVKVEEHQRANISKFERRQPRPLDVGLCRDAAGSELAPKVPEPRAAPPRVRPVPSLVPRPPQTSLVKFVGNIYTLKCRFCEVEFQGPLSIQEEWVRHLQRHILEMNFSQEDSLRSEAPVPPAPPAMAEAQ